MARFKDMTLVQGLEEILTSTRFDEGKDIVTTLEELIEANRVLREGKVATIISERTFEGDVGGEEDASHNEEANSTEQPPAQQAEQPPAPAAETIKPEVKYQEVLVKSNYDKVNELVEQYEKRFSTAPKLAESEVEAILAALSNGENISELINASEHEVNLPSEIHELALALDKIYQEEPEKAEQLINHVEDVIDAGGEVQDNPELSSEENIILKRMRDLPTRYHKILLQLLDNWEKQSRS